MNPVVAMRPSVRRIPVPVAVPVPMMRCAPPPPPVQVQYVEVTKEVPGPVQYVEVIKEVPGPVQYVEVIREVPGPVQYREVIKEVPVYIQVLGPERVVTEYIRQEVKVEAPPPPPPVRVESMKIQTMKTQKVKTVKESYKVPNLKVAITLSIKDGTDDAEADGRPIMVEGIGLLRDIYLANDVTTGKELDAKLMAGYKLKPITKHSERRAKLVFCSREVFQEMEEKSQRQVARFTSSTRQLLEILETALPNNAAWKQAFSLLDANADGIISKGELLQFLEFLAQRDPRARSLCTSAAADEILTSFDEDGNGTLDVTEFFWHVKVPSLGEPLRLSGCPVEVRPCLKDLNQFFGKNMGYLWMIFTNFDEDKSHTLSPFEVENMICMMAVNKPECAKYRAQAKRFGQEVVKFLDVDRSGAIDFTEFMALCQPRPFY